MEDNPKSIEEIEAPDPDSTSIGAREGGVSKVLRPEVVGAGDVGSLDVGTVDIIVGKVGTTVGAGAMGAGPGVDALTGFRPMDVGAGDDSDGDAGGRDVRTASAGAREEGLSVGFGVAPKPVGVCVDGKASMLRCGSAVGEGVREVSVRSIKAAKSYTPAFSSSHDPDVQPARTTDSLGPAATASK